MGPGHYSGTHGRTYYPTFITIMDSRGAVRPWPAALLPLGLDLAH